MIERNYLCNLCRTRHKPEELHGLYWGTSAIEKRAAGEVESHLCVKCLDDIAAIAYPVLVKRLDEMEKPCVWTFDEIHDKWDTNCGNAFLFIDGGPNDNECKFCCYCGHPIEEQSNE